MLVIFDVAKHIFNVGVKYPYCETEEKPHYSGYNPGDNKTGGEPQLYAELDYSNEAEYDTDVADQQEC